MVKNLDYPTKRWFILWLLMRITIMVEVQWLTYAPIARVASHVYEE